jgi:hypothetical protein
MGEIRKMKNNTYGLAWHGMVRQGTVRRGLVRLGVVWWGLVWKRGETFSNNSGGCAI